MSHCLAGSAAFNISGVRKGIHTRYKIEKEKVISFRSSYRSRANRGETEFLIISKTIWRNKTLRILFLRSK